MFSMRQCLSWPFVCCHCQAHWNSRLSLSATSFVRTGSGASHEWCQTGVPSAPSFFLCSPLLFSLYINDMGREISEGIEGAVTGDRVNCVSHMLYADDLGLTTKDPGEMQTMLNRLRTYAEKKGLTVNTAKSEVVHFNSLSLLCRIRSRTMVWCFQRRTGSNIWACCLIEGWIWR